MAADATSKLEILVQLRDEANASLRRLTDDLSDLGGNFNFAENAAGGLIGALQALGAGAVIGSSIKAFADAEAQTMRFETLLKTLPPGLQAYREEILKVADDAMVRFGFSNEDAALSIVQLMQVTRDAPLSFQAFQAAMDLARYKNIGLADATLSIVQAFQGNTRTLKALGVAVDEHASKAQVLAAIQGVVNGQAQAYSEITAGNIAVLKELGGQAQQALGGQFGPAISELTGQLRTWIIAQGGVNAILEQHKGIVFAVAVALATLAIAGFAVATAAALSMIGPLGLIAAGIAAVSAVALLLYTAWKLYWPDIAAIFVKAWEVIRDTFNAIWGSIVGAINSGVASIKSAIDSVVSAYNRVKSSISSGVSKISSGVTSAIKAVTPFADGGIVTGPTLGLVGEAGPEAIIPLSQLGSIGGRGITINLQGDFYTDEETAERFGGAIVRVLKNQLNLGGVKA